DWVQPLSSLTVGSGVTCGACPKYHDLSFDFSTHHDLYIFISGGSDVFFMTPIIHRVVLSVGILQNC
ncbi:hypothetical protein, partial [Pseudomonas aeruginosa]|uniref:hypothetical protein n=1 Tax=Pseudomonas aeruginosa TaxID=287 RepID=UPI0034E04618